MIELRQCNEQGWIDEVPAGRGFSMIWTIIDANQ